MSDWVELLGTLFGPIAVALLIGGILAGIATPAIFVVWLFFG